MGEYELAYNKTGLYDSMLGLIYKYMNLKDIIYIKVEEYAIKRRMYARTLYTLHP